MNQTTIVLATGLPASGKTTLLNEFKMANEDLCYFSSELEPAPRYIFKRSFTIVDKLFLKTEEVKKAIEFYDSYSCTKYKIFVFDKHRSHCLFNENVRLQKNPDKEPAFYTINNSDYEIDTLDILKSFPEFDIEFVPVKVYYPEPWEHYFNFLGIKLGYRRKSSNQYKIELGKHNRRYIVSDIWETNRTNKHYTFDWEEYWDEAPDEDPTPIDFEFFSRKGLDFKDWTLGDYNEFIKPLIKSHSFYIRDYYEKCTHNYEYVDAEELFNALNLQESKYN